MARRAPPRLLLHDRRRPGPTKAWALAERRAMARTVSPAYRFACAAMLPASWIGSSIAGAVLGGFLGDPKRFGARFAFTALVIGLVAGFNRAAPRRRRSSLRSRMKGGPALPRNGRVEPRHGTRRASSGHRLAGLSAAKRGGPRRAKHLSGPVLPDHLRPAGTQLPPRDRRVLSFRSQLCTVSCISARCRVLKDGAIPRVIVGTATVIVRRNSACFGHDSVPKRERLGHR